MWPADAPVMQANLEQQWFAQLHVGRLSTAVRAQQFFCTCTTIYAQQSFVQRTQMGTTSPFYSNLCTRVVCPANSSGKHVPDSYSSSCSAAVAGSVFAKMPHYSFSFVSIFNLKIQLYYSNFECMKFLLLVSSLEI